MDPHSLVSSSFWESDVSWLMQPGELTRIPNLSIPSLVFATSGSTGGARFLALSRQSLLTSARAVNEHCRVDASSVWGLCLPWWHVGGFGVIARAHVSGCQLAIDPERWNANSCFTWLSESRVTHLSLVPTQLHDLVEAGFHGPASLKVIIVGGGRLEAPLARKAREQGWPALASYGMTEAGSQIATQDPDSLNHPYDSEFLPILPHWQLRVDDAGQISIRGPALFHGELQVQNDSWSYHKRQGDWYETNDCGELLDNRILVTHRADTLVKVLGELVNPAAMESQLIELGLPSGKIAVLALSHPRQQHRLVMVHENLPETWVATVLEKYHQRCRGYERLTEVVCLPDFPRSDMGKILRKLLISRLPEPFQFRE
jgi:O-succinylbenzoic acid--CoA ligase